MLMHHQQRIALGSPIDLTLVSDKNQGTVDDLFRHLWLKIFAFERQFSRFLPDSELSQFNRAAGVKTPISQEFHDILAASLKMSELTDGLYNPFILPALQSVGYVHSMVAAHSDDEADDFSSRSVVAPERLQLTKETATIPYGTAIDLGGIGKGYLGDQLADYADSLSELNGYWFSLGGDIVASGQDANGEGWQIQVEDTARAQAIAGTAASKKSNRHAVATSSSLRRTGKSGGKTWHHIIDPRTNKPSESNVVTASIHAGSLCLADILASCAVILGSDVAPSFCTDRGATGTLLQTGQGLKLSTGDFTVDSA